MSSHSLLIIALLICSNVSKFNAESFEETTPTTYDDFDEETTTTKPTPAPVSSTYEEIDEDTTTTTTTVANEEYIVERVTQRPMEVSMEVVIRGDNLTMSYKVEPLPQSYAHLGESPHWDIEKQSLYYVDIEAGKLLRYDYQQDKVYSCKIDGVELAAFIVPVEGEDGKFVIGDKRRVLVVSWDGVSPQGKIDRVLFEVQPGEKYANNRFNDAKADPRGRLFAGTMVYIGDEFKNRYGELYKYEKGGKVSLVKSDVGISNGLAWNENTNKMYYIDTADYEVKEYDYDFENGVPSNPKVVFNLRKPNPKNNLLPDGMTIDSEGNIYVATFNGHTLYKINPTTGRVLLEIKFPCKQITSAAFGGPNLDILYVTTSAKFDQPAPAGTTYKITGLGSKGLPMYKVQL